MTEEDDLLSALVERLSIEHHCHTIILYGSRARGDATSVSDYDVVAFHDGEGSVTRETGHWQGALMDVFFYSTDRLQNPGAEFLRVRGGRILKERGDLGRRFLETLDELYAKGPDPLSSDDLFLRRNWAWKTFDRTARGDVIGDFRRHHLLVELLESYFLLRQQWYLGPNEALALLKTNDPTAFNLFQAALIPDASLEEVQALVGCVVGLRP